MKIVVAANVAVVAVAVALWLLHLESALAHGQLL